LAFNWSFRALAHIWDGKCELVSRKRNSYKSFQGLRDNLAMLKVKNAVLDGEIVCLGSEGGSIFNDLLHRKGFPVFYAFDLIYLDGHDLRQLPLVERKQKLRETLDKSRLPDVICGKYVEGRGIDLFTEVCLRNLEGIVAKRKTGTYSTISGWLNLLRRRLWLHGGICRRFRKNRHAAPPHCELVRHDCHKSDEHA
jgi:bifunctional non-homologous end joining protein LigD